MLILEKKFINENINRSQIEDFLAKEFTRAGYSHTEIARTPVALRITIWAQKPGVIIGRSGKTIDALTDTLKTKFGLENPQLDVKEVERPELDAPIVARQIAAAIEKGLNYKRVVNFTLEKVMAAGAVGIAVRAGGKVGGEMSRVEKFSAGYLKYAGEPAEQLSKGYATANMKLGIIGVQVRILTEKPKELAAIESLASEKASEKAEVS